MDITDIKKIPLVYVRGNQSNKQLFDKCWEVGKNITVQLSNGDVIVIPKGFKTDLSSVPEFLWGIFKPFGDWLLAAIVHDYLYKFSDYFNYSRKFVDKEMLKMSLALGAKKVDAYTRYYAVRAFGAKIYNK